MHNATLSLKFSDTPILINQFDFGLVVKPMSEITAAVRQTERTIMINHADLRK